MCRVQIYFTVLMVAFGALAEEQDAAPYESKGPMDAVMGPAADKRGPSGFMGMRGKKLLYSNDYPNEGGYKRVPMGFSAMRGKKNSLQDEYSGGNGDLLEKRAPVGFLGMRGKKDYELLEEMNGHKRAPAAGFFGMRGKKQPAYGFFGSRGKKYPYELRGNFVGVRGKKFSNSVLRDSVLLRGDQGSNSLGLEDDLVWDELSALAKGLDINQLILLLTESEQRNEELSRN